METRKKQVTVPVEELKIQFEYTEAVRKKLSEIFAGRTPLAYVRTYGCQGNVSDSERIRGMLCAMGFEMTDDDSNADLILFNTCAIREHAEDRVFGNVGALKHNKRRNRDLIIALCGCMMQQPHIAEKIKKSFPYVDLVFGTHVIHKLPEYIFSLLNDRNRIFSIPDEEGVIAEGLPTYRDSGVKAWLPIMYGCNNFCSYCIVPYVRGRERSRESKLIIEEFKELVKQGYKDITLLGQNVNSYGKGLDEDIDFARLLRQINDIEGEFIVRFMTSHPKDCTRELLETMAQCDKVAKHIHLPFQSGNDRVLAAMNRSYTREKYLSLIDYAYELMPDLSVTSDVIVGFPGETEEEFEDTLSLIERVRFTSLFTFIFSARKGTPAAEMEDKYTLREKTARFKRLTDAQEKIAGERNAEMCGKTVRVLAEEIDDKGNVSGRTQGNVIIIFPADKNIIGQFCNVRITECRTWILKGELVQD
ncbi:MAG: tRNA (N6-isopentenyl adenosine(37)-C2)-methylthiotransferase MiaB [Clostridia bacterium]|nr:tRNA (N6-isopentenyl adenosine(37)-C2)-methylthiotransferase MiaB [Clostridia bacterium]